MQKVLHEMQKVLLSTNKMNQETEMIQNMIYFFNQPHVRDHLIDFHIKTLPLSTKVEWDGTYFFDEKGITDVHHHKGINLPLSTFLKQKNKYDEKNNVRFIISTCCVTYEGNRVHFLSMIYDKKQKSLIFFDPGIHMYEKGQDVAVPIVHKAFIDNGWVKNIERVGLCPKNYYGRKWGIQYNGDNPMTSKLPADSFCQSWTLYYLIEFIRNKCSDKFFTLWCSIEPDARETFILMNFFLPHIQHDKKLFDEWKQFYPEGDLQLLNQYTINNFAKNNNNNKSKN